MKEKLTISDVTPEMKSTVHAYLVARAFAETMRSEVDKIQRAILAESPLPLADEWKNGRRGDSLPRWIDDPKSTYLAEDSAFAAYCAECDKRERAAGLKPADMPDEYCPALVAEEKELHAKWDILDHSAKMIGFDFDGKELNSRLISRGGIECQQQFIDVVVGLVLSLPNA